VGAAEEGVSAPTRLALAPAVTVVMAAVSVMVVIFVFGLLLVSLSGNDVIFADSELTTMKLIPATWDSMRREIL
jgi:hypothetical protein